MWHTQQRSRSSVRPNLKLGGIIILHDITTARIAGSSTLVSPGGMPHPPNVAFVTTKWPASECYLNECVKHEVELQSLLSVVPKMEVKRFDNSAKSAWKIIDDVSPLSGVELDTRRRLLAQLERILNQSKATMHLEAKHTGL